jgi:hypothetical protein
MRQVPRTRKADDVASMESKIIAGVKKRQALTETLEPSLTVKTGNATKVERK